MHNAGMEPSSCSIELPLAFYRARFTHPLPTSEWVGDLLRRRLGPPLKRHLCVTGLPVCQTCPVYHDCGFAYLWFTPPPRAAAVMRNYETAPHPYVLQPQPQAPHTLVFVLVGRANALQPVFLPSLQAAVRAAVGDRAVRLGSLECAQAFTAQAEPVWGACAPDRPASAIVPVPSSAPTSCRIELLSPLRIKREGRYARVEDFRFADLFGHLLRRISLMTHFHGVRPHQTDFAALMAQARAMTVRAQLAQKILRRPGRAAPWYALQGVLEIEGAALPALWPYLWLGQLIHAGSGATMGLGRYRLLETTAGARGAS